LDAAQLAIISATASRNWPARQFARGQGFQRRADVEDVLDFLSVEVTDREPTPRTGGDQALLLQLTHRLAQRAAADLQRIGQIRLHQVRAR
jgi:hypothetical protein